MTYTPNEMDATIYDWKLMTTSDVRMSMGSVMLMNGELFFAVFQCLCAHMPLDHRVDAIESLAIRDAESSAISTLGLIED